MRPVCPRLGDEERLEYSSKTTLSSSSATYNTSSPIAHCFTCSSLPTFTTSWSLTPTLATLSSASVQMSSPRFVVAPGSCPLLPLVKVISKAHTVDRQLRGPCLSPLKDHVNVDVLFQSAALCSLHDLAGLQQNNDSKQTR
jgi:hypothetical protein